MASKSPEERRERPRGKGGFRAAGASIDGRLRPAAQQMGFAETDVLLRWNEIVGEALAGLCTPVRVGYGKGGTIGATLMVRAEGAVALKVEHMAPRIIERVNAHYGYRAITRVTITQGTGLRGHRRGRTPAAGFAEPAAPFEGAASAGRGPDGRASPADDPLRGEARPPAPVTERAETEAAAMAGGIRTPALRDALARMGAYVLSRPPGADNDGTGHK